MGVMYKSQRCAEYNMEGPQGDGSNVQIPQGTENCMEGLQGDGSNVHVQRGAENLWKAHKVMA